MLNGNFCIPVPFPTQACFYLAGENKSGMRVLFDSMVQALGKAAFFPQFAVFPVKYLDGDMAVFTFPPLRDSLIAVRKTS